MDDAFKYIIANKGLDTEASYPYSNPPATGPCKFKAASVGATISSFTDVSSGSEVDLQTAVVQQPISVAIDASHNSFQLYLKGVYYEKECSSTSLDHGVLTIGYGTTSNSTDYWLVKNSWGTTWGIDGYIQMSRNRGNNCGIATMASYPTAGSLATTTHHETTSTRATTAHATTAHTVATHNSGPAATHNSGPAATHNSGSTTYSGGVSELYESQGGKGYKPTKKDQTAKFNF